MCIASGHRIGINHTLRERLDVFTDRVFVPLTRLRVSVIWRTDSTTRLTPIVNYSTYALTAHPQRSLRSVARITKLLVFVPLTRLRVSVIWKTDSTTRPMPFVNYSTYALTAHPQRSLRSVARIQYRSGQCHLPNTVFLSFTILEGELPPPPSPVAFGGVVGPASHIAQLLHG
jgi:hypothetical protein